MGQGLGQRVTWRSTAPARRHCGLFNQKMLKTGYVQILCRHEIPVCTKSEQWKPGAHRREARLDLGGDPMATRDAPPSPTKERGTKSLPAWRLGPEQLMGGGGGTRLHLCFDVLSLMTDLWGPGHTEAVPARGLPSPVWLQDTSPESLGPKQPSYLHWGLGISSGASVATRTQTLPQRKAAGPRAPRRPWARLVNSARAREPGRLMAHTGRGADGARPLSRLRGLVSSCSNFRRIQEWCPPADQASSVGASTFPRPAPPRTARRRAPDFPLFL